MGFIYSWLLVIKVLLLCRPDFGGYKRSVFKFITCFLGDSDQETNSNFLFKSEDLSVRLNYETFVCQA